MKRSNLRFTMNSFSREFNKFGIYTFSRNNKGVYYNLRIAYCSEKREYLKNSKYKYLELFTHWKTNFTWPISDFKKFLYNVKIELINQGNYELAYNLPTITDLVKKY